MKKTSRKKTLQLELKDNSKAKEYKIEKICNNIVDLKELKSSYFLGFYYLIFLKSFLQEKNI